MKLITELNQNTKVVSDEDKNFYVEGIFIQTNMENQNGRIYESSVVDPVINEYIETKVKGGTALGELDHPETLEINLDRVSHRIVELRKDGDNYIGKALITRGTPCGAIAHGLIESGCTLGMSTRGAGDIVQENDKNFVRNFFLVTAGDLVADPSAPQAFVQGIYEKKEWVWDNGIIKEQEVQAIKDTLDKKYSDEEIVNAFKNIFRK